MRRPQATARAARHLANKRTPDSIDKLDVVAGADAVDGSLCRTGADRRSVVVVGTLIGGRADLPAVTTFHLSSY
jgi:hypothetical protein